MNIFNLYKLTSIFVAVFALSACVTTKVVSSSGGQTIQQVQAESYSGPKQRIAVKEFTFKAASGSKEIGKGMSDMLTDALFNTGKFIVVEREHIQDVIKEQDFGASGRVRQDTAAAIGEIEGAQLLIRGSVIQFEPNCRGGSLLLISTKRACMAINLRIIDARTGRVVNATTVEGTSDSAGVGLVFATASLPIGLGGWSTTPMEKAIRITIEAAVKHIANAKL